MRPDQGLPETLFVFNKQGGITAVPAEMDAQRTVEDFQLNRSGLCRFRRVAIQRELRMLHGMIESSLPMEEKRQ